MKQIALCLGMMLVTSLVQAKELVLTIDGKPVKLNSNIMNREITVKDKDAGDRRSALNCSFLYYSLLAADQVEKASRLSFNPEQTREQLTQYRERLGAEEFRKTMNEFFTEKNVVVAELINGAMHMLVIRTQDDALMAQMYKKQGSDFSVFDSLGSEDAKVMGKIYSMIRKGELKL